MLRMLFSQCHRMYVCKSLYSARQSELDLKIWQKRIQFTPTQQLGIDENWIRLIITDFIRISLQDFFTNTWWWNSIAHKRSVFSLLLKVFYMTVFNIFPVSPKNCNSFFYFSSFLLFFLCSVLLLYEIYSRIWHSTRNLLANRLKVKGKGTKVSGSCMYSFVLLIGCIIPHKAYIFRRKRWTIREGKKNGTSVCRHFREYMKRFPEMRCVFTPCISHTNR